jgi:type IX secretion system PorP/SprF family membrane protein
MTFTKSIFPVLFFWMFLYAFPASGQQDPMFSQYMLNIQSFNPAYTGSWDAIGITLFSRQQWMGFKNNPETQELTFQTPITNTRLGVGFSLMNESIGMINRRGVFLDYSFGIPVGVSTTVRLGIKGGLTNYRSRFSELILVDPDDLILLPGEVDRYLPNFGVGAFLHSPNIYVGISVPKLLQNERADFSNVISMSDLIVIGGVVIRLAPGIDMKPSFNFHYLDNAPFVTDLNLSFLFADVFWIGGLFRTSDEIRFGLFTNILIGKTLRIGYAYDFMNYAGLNSYSGGTHEMMVSFELRRKEKIRFKSPRYF